jgi:hypothetical protein
MVLYAEEAQFSKQEWNDFVEWVSGLRFSRKDLNDD